MLKIIKLTLISAAIFSLASCASYNSIMPDWAKIGESAETEINEDSSTEILEPVMEDAQSSEQDESAPIRSDKRIIASPLAKKIASEKNIDLSTIQGSGDNGRIIKSDLDNVDSSQSNLDESKPIEIIEDQKSIPPPVINTVVGEESFDDIQNSSMRHQ